ncbi:MAG: hypothetical protein ACR2KE_02010 [Candidatus Nanopelagicales bacterium]
MIRRLFTVLLAAVVVFVGLQVFPSVRQATTEAVDAGRTAFGAAGNAVDAAGGVVDAVSGVVGGGSDAVSQASDTVAAARQLNTACDLVREAVAPGTSPEESASKLQEAMAIVGGVVKAYPDVPGISDLERGLKVSKQALAADPSGQSLGLTSSAVESACSQLPPVP